MLLICTPVFLIIDTKGKLMIGYYDYDNKCWLSVVESAEYFGISEVQLRNKLKNVGVVRGVIERIYNKNIGRTILVINVDRIHLVAHLINRPLDRSAPKYLANRAKFKLVKISKKQHKQR